MKVNSYSGIQSHTSNVDPVVGSQSTSRETKRRQVTCDRTNAPSTGDRNASGNSLIEDVRCREQNQFTADLQDHGGADLLKLLTSAVLEEDRTQTI